MINKCFHSSIQLIKNLLFERVYKVQECDVAFMLGKEIHLTKEERQFKIKILFSELDKKYFNDVLDTPITPYSIKSNLGKTFHAPARSTLLSGFYPSNNSPDNYYDYEVNGSLIQLMTTSDITLFDNKFHRLIIPIQNGEARFHDFQRWHFETDIKSKSNELIKLLVNSWEFHLVSFEYEGNNYWGVDSLQQMELKQFQTLAFSILTSYGFLKGNLFLGEAYYFCSDSLEFSNPEMLYSSLRDSLKTGYGIFTTNAYSVYVPYFKNQKIVIDHEKMKQWLSKLPLFSADLFSKLAEYLENNEKLSRAVLIILEANTQPLELKAASYCVAYESICHTIKELVDIKTPSSINDENWELIKPEFSALLRTLQNNKRIDQEQFEILTRKLHNWNQPTNRDSLTAPFKKFNYVLTDIEYKCIDNRNKFLHGSLPFKFKDEDEAFKELYFISLTIHKLACILMLKLIGFEHYIINYAKMHEYITNKMLDEEVLIKI